MRRLCTGLLAAALTLGLLAAQPAEAKVYKMAPEERAQALKEKKAKRAQAKKTGKAAPGQGQGGWVEVKPGEKIVKKNKKSSRVDEIAQAAEKKGQKGKKPAKEAPAAPEKKDKKAQKGKKAAEEIVVEKKGKKTSAKADKKSGKKSAARGDRLVGSDFGGERKVSASSTEVRRPAATPPSQSGQPGQADDLNAYSVSRPGQEKAPVVPEVRQEVQPGPLDTSKPVGTEPKGGEGRF